MINYEEFSKVELKVGKVLEASRVEGSDKLLKLKVDLGEKVEAGDPSGASEPESKTRQVIAGIGKMYEPDYLVGKSLVFVANLEPRSLMGLESQGMILAASSESGPVVLVPEKDVLPGSGVK